MSRPPHRHKPPMREGVSASCVALPHGPWLRLIDFLAERLPAVSATQWQQRMAQGRVLDEAGAALPPEAPYRSGTRVYYYRELEAEPAIPFEEEILYQDEHLLVADKPHFLPVTPTGRYVQQTLLVRLKRRTGIDSLSPIHRIDRETAGLVVFSVRAQDRGAYQRLFREQVVEKDFRQREVPGEPNSETQIALIEVRGALARYRLRPLSGRTHQLRVHMLALGRPIAGDLFYPEVVHGPGQADEDHTNPLRLLARAMAFTDPITGVPRRFESRRQLSWPSGC